MIRARKHSSSGAPPARRRAVLTFVAMAIVVSLGLVAPAEATGAWFTAKQTLNNNALSSATIDPVTGLSATARDDGVNVRWIDAQQQQWATANQVSSGVTYSVTRTVDGKNPATVYDGTSTIASDPYPLPEIVKRSPLSASERASQEPSTTAVCTHGVQAQVVRSQQTPL